MSGGKFTSKPGKARIDAILVMRGLAETEKRAQAMIIAGEIRVNGQPAMKPGAMFPSDAKIELIGKRPKYASRAGLKLEGALEDFGVDVAGHVCLDIGASAGGFTDCLLQRGARRVYAVDVSTSQLDWRLQRDERVAAIQKNARYLKPEDVPETVDLVTIDVSFIAVSKILPAAAAIAKPGATFLILVKPQFELPKLLIGKGGIVSDPALQERAIASVRAAAEHVALEILGMKPSRVAGAEGNQEFFLLARRAG